MNNSRRQPQHSAPASHAGTLAPNPRMMALPRFHGLFEDIDKLNALMAQAIEHCHLISPAAICSAIPDGYSVIVTPVFINPSASGAVFKLYGTGTNTKYMLAKPSLFQISRAAGVSWDPRESRRVDSERVPLVWRYKAVGSYRDFSGERLGIGDEKEIDARDGSAQIDVITARAKRKQQEAEKEGKQIRVNPDAEIRELRLHGYSHAVTKAHLRAVRTLGIATSYTLDELRKPFVAVNTAFTGRSADPERARMFSMMIAQRALGMTDGLYGPDEGAVMEAPRVRVSLDSPYPTARSPSVAKAAAPAAPPLVVPPLPEKLSGYKVRRGLLAGQPIEALTTKELVRHCEELRDDIEEGITFDSVSDANRLDAVYAEIQRRETL